jgi:hypothetical protein
MLKMLNYNQKLTDHKHSGHTCFFYTSEQDRLQVIAEYLDEGIRNNELCILVTRHAPAVTVKAIQGFGVNLMPAIASSGLRIYSSEHVYLPYGSFDAARMLQNLTEFLAQAHEENYTGLRTAGELDWARYHQDAHDKLAEYEAKVNDVGQGFNFTGLCLYSAKNTPQELIQRAVVTHPTILYKQTVHSNPHFAGSHFSPTTIDNLPQAQSSQQRIKEILTV